MCVKGAETGIECILLSGAHGLRAGLPLDLTDLPINRKSYLSLKLRGDEGGRDGIEKCLAEDLAWRQPELLRE